MQLESICDVEVCWVGYKLPALSLSNGEGKRGGLPHANGPAHKPAVNFYWTTAALWKLCPKEEHKLFDFDQKQHNHNKTNHWERF